jgi:hypothetical protein
MEVKKNLCLILRRIIRLLNGDLVNVHLIDILEQTKDLVEVCKHRDDSDEYTTSITEAELKKLYLTPLKDQENFSIVLDDAIDIAFNDKKPGDFLGGRKSRRQRKQRKSRRHRQSRRWF